MEFYKKLGSPKNNIPYKKISEELQHYFRKKYDTNPRSLPENVCPCDKTIKRIIEKADMK